jgi:hypothetical protein
MSINMMMSSGVLLMLLTVILLSRITGSKKAAEMKEQQ